MKKFFLMIAAGLIATGASAQKLVWEYDYADKTSFPWYKMSTEADFCTFEDGAMVSHNPLNENGEPVWYQYFIADNIPAKPGESYTAVVTCKASADVTVNVNMGWGWGEGEQRSASLAMTTDYTDVSLVYKDVNLGQYGDNLVLQTTFDGEIYIKTIKVYLNPPAAQYETEAVTTVNYAELSSYPYDDLGAAPVINDGVLSFTPVPDPEDPEQDSNQFYAMYNVKFEPETFYGIVTKVKGSKAGTAKVALGSWGETVDADLDITEEWTEVSLPIGEVKLSSDPEEEYFVLVTLEGYEGTVEMEYCTLAVFTEIIPEPTTEWVSIITNGNANDGESANMIDREPEKEDYEATICDNPSGEGKVFYCPIVNNPDPGVNPQTDAEKAEHPDWSGVYDWSSQFFILFNEALEADTNIKVSFDYYCTDSRTINTQAHGEPGDYHHWQFIGDLSAKPEWQHIEWEGEITGSHAGANGCLSIAFNLSTAEPAATFYINNVVVEVEKDIEENAVKTVNAIVVPAAGVYNLQGVKVADTLDNVTVPGLYISNGKKVIKK
ncbi:MAG: hypothetical protein K2H49_06805 [Muribaculaceae bacterium]|nr:hypothetical protein [Muribaculaceae bacterium]